jgi:hypothetical protein
MLQGVRRYIVRTLKADAKKIDAIVMGPLLNLAGCDTEELKRRVQVWLSLPHDQYLHIQGKDASIIYVYPPNKFTYIIIYRGSYKPHLAMLLSYRASTL